MEQKRTYLEAVNLMVNWWVEKITTPLNQNNGDTGNDMGWALMNLASSSAQEELSESKIEKFKAKLKEQLLANEQKGRYMKELDVDYHPNEILNNACVFSEINTLCLPCKTFTYIDEDNIINGRYQYGGAWFKL